MLMSVMFWNQSEPENLTKSFKLSERTSNNILWQCDFSACQLDAVGLCQSIFQEYVDPPIYLALCDS